MQRTISLFLAFLTLACTRARAQENGCTGETFVQVLRDESGLDVRATCVLPYPGAGNDLLIAGTVGGDVFLTRIGRQGDLRWRRVISTPSLSTELSTLAEVVVDEEGMIAGVGSSFDANNEQRLYLFRYDPLADQVSYLRQAPWSSEGTGIELGDAGEYLVSGSKNGEPPPVFNAAYLARVDRQTGVFIDAGTTFDFRGDEGILDLQRLPDGSIFCGGNVSATGGSGDTRASITRLAPDGSHLWTRIGYASSDVNARLFTFDVEVVDNTVFVLSWGNVGVITGSINTAMILSAFELNGEHRWTRRYDVADFPGEEAVELVPYRDGLLAYGFSLIGDRSTYLIHLDAQGEVRWGRTYDLPGSAIVYFRCNQQLLADEEGIVALATYSFSGRPREGVVMNLDEEGRTDNPCVPVNDAEIVVTNLGTDWAEISLEPSDQTTPWDPLNSNELPVTFVAYDDCDVPCDDCLERTFSRQAICQGSSVILGGSSRSESGVYADTIPGSVTGCDSILLTELVVSNGPSVTAIVDRSCGFATADVRLEVAGGEFPYTYSWSVPEAEGQRASLPAGSYRVTVNDALACNPATVDILVEPAAAGGPDFRFNGPFCPGDSTGFIRLEPAGSGSIRLLPEGNFVPDRLDGLVPGDYSVILRDSSGCEAFRQVLIPQPRPAEIMIEAPELVRLGDEVSLSTRAAFGSLFNNFQWSATDSLRCPDCAVAQLRAATSGFVSVSALTERGCPVQDSVFLTVLRGDPRLYFPTGFSPNNDRVNDLWTPGLGPEVDRVLSLEIYDRWGAFVWAYANDESWWDGGDQPVGLYVFKTEILLIDGRRVEDSGSIVLVR